MTSTPLRMTTTTLKVLAVLAATSPDEDAFGLRIIRETGLGSGTVYPILDRLERAGWIVGTWETKAPADRPKRRSYNMTAVGSAAYQQALSAREARQARWGLRSRTAGT